MTVEQIAIQMENKSTTIENGTTAKTDAKPVLAEGREYLLCSAIWFDDGVSTYLYQPRNIKTGFVVCGRRHHNCFITKAILFQRGASHACRGASHQGLDIKDYEDRFVIQGFLTNKDRFVDRYEAAKIALESGQIKEPTAKLYSEDVW
jgi:hypothetical protein